MRTHREQAERAASQAHRAARELLRFWEDAGNVKDAPLKGYPEAAALAKHLEPGETQLALRAHRILRRAVAYDLTHTGEIATGAPALLSALVRFLDAEGVAAQDISRGSAMAGAPTGEV